MLSCSTGVEGSGAWAGNCDEANPTFHVCLSFPLFTS